MHRVLVIAAALGVLVAWAPRASAQSHPDLSGTWIVQNVDVQRPEGGANARPGGGGGGGGFGGRGGFGRRGGFGGGQGRGGRTGGGGRGAAIGDTFQRDDRVTITQTDDGLIVTNEAEGRMSRYSFDGHETTNPGPRDSTIKSKAHWDGAALVVESTLKMTTTRNGDQGGRDINVDSRQIWSITPEGPLKLETRTKTPRGNTTATVTFTRADR